MARPHTKPTRFTDRRVEAYLDRLRNGAMKTRAAEAAGVSYKTVVRRRQNDPEFAEEEELALRYALESVHEVLFTLALEGDIKAVLPWLAAHDRSVVYPTFSKTQTTKVEIDATPAALEMSKNELFSQLAELQSTLEKRRAELVEDGVVDVESFEETPRALPAEIVPDSEE